MPNGAVSVFAGSGADAVTNGVGTSAAFKGPRGMALDDQGNLYVADYDGHVIRKVTPTGVVTTLAGSGTPGSVDGTGANASLRHPYDLDIDSNGNIIVAEYSSHLIRKVTPEGVVTTVSGLRHQWNNGW